MAITFTYDETTNKVVCTEGTSGTPATCADMYVADQAGTGTVLLVAENAAADNTLTYQIRPPAARALIIKCIVAGENGSADFIFITGTDAWGAAQTESLDVSAGDGTYTTTKRFRTITNLDCSDNANGGGTVWAEGTIAVTQDIWGVVWEIVQDAVYKIDCNIDFGDGATATYFQSTNEMVYFEDGKCFSNKANSTFQSGEPVGDYGKNGSIISITLPDDRYINYGTFKFYASTLHARDGVDYKGVQWADGDVYLISSVLSASGSFKMMNTIESGVDNLYARNFTMLNLNRLRIDRDFDVAERVISVGCSFGIWANADVSVSDLLIANASTDIGVSNNRTFRIIDSGEISSITNSNAGSKAISLYTCNIHVTDKSGADLAGVDVDVTYANLVEGSDDKTYKCIQNQTAVDAIHKPITGSDWESYWVLYDADGGLGGDWDTGFDYKADEPEFSTVTTDANGDISEQVIQYKKWVGTSETLEARIHIFTYSHTDYPTYTINNVIVSSPIDWRIEMPISTNDLQEAIWGYVSNASNIVPDSMEDKVINIQGTVENAIDEKIDTTNGVIDHVALVDTTTSNTDMVGTNGANTTVPDTAGTAASLHTTTDAKIDGIVIETNNIEQIVWRHVPNMSEVTPNSMEAKIIDNNDVLNNQAGPSLTMVDTEVDDTGFVPTTTQFESSEITESLVDHYEGRVIIFRTGALAKAASNITAYSLVGGRGRFTVAGFPQAPVDGDEFSIV